MTRNGNSQTTILFNNKKYNMGLDISHDAWHGAYSSFMRWREKIAEVAGLPPLQNMEGFGGPIKWESLEPSPLHELLHHSDCDGEISWKSCGAIADELEKLLPKLNGDGGGHIGSYKEKTEQFIKGLRKAHKKKQELVFA